MHQQNESEEIPPGALQCNFCHDLFSEEMPHFSCTRVHGGNREFNVCQICFFQWVHGEIRADNVGFRKRSCSCGERISHVQVQAVLEPNQFAAYDDALTRATLARDTSVIHCPGTDCENSFVKPKRTKKKCRKAECDECGVLLCCKCGELYTTQHQRMKCAQYKKWKQTHDEDTLQLTKWAQSRENVKKCPGCKRNVERNMGCNDMRCTNCGLHFCWACAKPKNGNNECGCP